MVLNANHTHHLEVKVRRTTGLPQHSITAEWGTGQYLDIVLTFLHNGIAIYLHDIFIHILHIYIYLNVIWYNMYAHMYMYA